MPPRSPRLSHARISGLLALAISLVAAAPASAQLLSAPVTTEAATPDLIDRAEERGAIDLERASLLRLYALRGDPRLPEAYESNRPWRGTILDLQLRRDLPKLDPGAERTAVREALRAPANPNPTTCSTSVAPPPNAIETAHFYIQYNAASPIAGGLDINDYADSLEEVYATEVSSFFWAPPPQNAAAASQIPGKYHVRVEPLGAGLYGFVSSGGTYAGRVGNNPNTSWNDVDADASCMVLNSDFETGFPGTAQQAMDATTAHEYNHSIQFGYGALNGTNVPEFNFVEGGATWMEDEAQDAANDNYNYLYPEFDDSMGEHEGNEYSYWLTWRGITERFGANVPGGAEQVMQAFWEVTSRNEGNMLTAMQQALATKQRTLPETFHDYAVAAKHMRTCGGNYFLPYCFEEAAGYVASAPGGAPPPSNGTIAAAGGSFSGTIEDNYTINWVTLPNTGSYNVTLATGTGAGQLRATISCDTASGIALAPFPAVVGPSSSQTVPGFDRSSCTQAPVAVITNQSQTAPNPDDTTQPYTLSTATASGGPTSPVVPAPPSEVAPDNGPAPPQDPGGSTGGGAGGGSTGGGTGGGSTTLLADTLDPVIGSVGFSIRRFRAARSGAAIRSAPVGTRLRYGLSEAARVTLRYERRTRGRRVAGRCRALTRRNRGRATCSRWVLVRGSARHSGRAGANSLRLSGRIGGRTLKPGVYRLRLSARDGAGNASRLRRSPSLRIIRR